MGLDVLVMPPPAEKGDLVPTAPLTTERQGHCKNSVHDQARAPTPSSRRSSRKAFRILISQMEEAKARSGKVASARVSRDLHPSLAQPVPLSTAHRQTNAGGVANAHTSRVQLTVSRASPR